MAFERIELNICPAGDMPVFHCSQYDVGRPIIIDLLNGDDAFTPSAGTTFELHCRKVDDNIVTLDTYEVDGNTLTFTSTEQLCACPGDNLCEVAIYLDELCMGTLNFMLHVEPDPLAGGLESETQIYNLYEQVEEITEQVIGDDYYNKTQVDDLLDDKADKATTYTKTEVDTALNLKADKSTTYTKTETNNLLAGKADASETYTKAQVDSKLSLKADKATTYTKTETDTLLGYKANASQVYTMSQTDILLADKADKSTTYTKTEVNNALALKANTADLATVATTGDYDDLINKPTIPAAQVQSDYAQTDNTQVDYIKNKPDLSIYATEEELILTTGTEDQTPYLLRDTPNGAGNKCLDMIVGGTVAFNQLVKNGNFESISYWNLYGSASYTVNDNVANVTPTSGSSGISQNTNILKHKYFVNCDIKLSTANSTTRINVAGGALGTYYADANTNWQNISHIVNSSFEGTFATTIGTTSSEDIYDFELKNINIIDLTAMFGSTIADYIYTLESGTAGAGVAWLKSHGYLTKPYYDYNAGGLVSVKTSKHVTRDSSNNIIGEYALDGSRKVHRVFGIVDLGELNWDYSDGLFVAVIDERKAGSVKLCCSRYATHTGTRGTISDKQIGSYNLTNSKGIVVKDSAYTDAPTFTTAMSGVYLVYELTTPFDETVSNPELRGIPMLDSDNNLYYYGDTCEDFTNPQIVDGNGTEEYIDGRDFEMPVGHDTIYAKKTSYRYW